MKTEAQKQFDADYIIRRRLFMMCDSVDGGAEQMKTWLRSRAVTTVLESKNEINSDKFKKLLASPSIWEKEELKIYGLEDE